MSNLDGTSQYYSKYLPPKPTNENATIEIWKAHSFVLLNDGGRYTLLLDGAIVEAKDIKNFELHGTITT